MRRTSVILASIVASCLILPQFASAQGLSAARPQRVGGTTLDFVNVTSMKIQQNVPEQSGNEKEVEFGDFDNDGDPDVVVAVALSDFTDRRNKIYRNDDGVFVEVTNTRAFVGGPWILQSATGGAGFMDDDVTRNAFLRDYDLDGWLDLIMVSDSNNGSGGITRFYHNKHPKDIFTHFQEETDRLNGAGGAACSAVSFDVDNDNDADLYLGNYPFNSQDTMYLNDGTGNFTSVTSTQVPTEQDYTVDVSSADLNGDNKTDLIVTSSFGDASYLSTTIFTKLATRASVITSTRAAATTWARPTRRMRQNLAISIMMEESTFITRTASATPIACWSTWVIMLLHRWVMARPTLQKSAFPVLSRHRHLARLRSPI